MIGIMFLTGVSWLLFWFIFKKNLFQFWFSNLQLRTTDALIGACIALLAFAIPLVLKSIIYSIDWHYNQGADARSLFSALFFYFKSIMFEELIFRGVILTLLADFTRNKVAVILSAIVFGIYQWFSYGMFGSGLIPMIYVFLLTGGMGFVWAYIYLKTNSIVMPAVIHLLWNFQSSLFLDYQPFGQLLFELTSAAEYSELFNFVIVAGGELMSILIMFGLFQFYIRNKKRADLNESALLPS